MKNTYQIDPAHSSVQFSIRHMMISNVRGSFSAVSGTLEYDSDNVADSKVTAEIDISTLSTGDTTRDGHVKSPDFFDVANHPKMTFVSKRFEKAGDEEYKVTGDLTMHGITKEVVLTVSDVTPEGKDLWGNIRIGAVARGQVNRKDFGLTWGAVLETGGVALGDTVKLDMELQFVKAQVAA